MRQRVRLLPPASAAVTATAAQPHRAIRPPCPQRQNSVPRKKAHKRLEVEVRNFSLELQGTKFKIAILTGLSMVGGMWLVNKRFKGVVVGKARRGLASRPARGRMQAAHLQHPQRL